MRSGLAGTGAFNEIDDRALNLTHSGHIFNSFLETENDFLMYLFKFIHILESAT